MEINVEVTGLFAGRQLQWNGKEYSPGRKVHIDWRVISLRDTLEIHYCRIRLCYQFCMLSLFTHNVTVFVMCTPNSERSVEHSVCRHLKKSYGPLCELPSI